MTILSAIRSAVLRVQGVALTEVFASTELVAVEMADLSNEVAADIAKSHDWRNLTKVATITGGGETHALPSDYDRMVMASDIDDATNWFWGYEAFGSVNDWLRFKGGAYPIMSPGGWIIIGGEFQFYPAVTGEATFPYVSNAWAKSEAGVARSQFIADTDTFVLDERLLTLGLIWRFLDQKGYPYSEAMATYEMALSQAQARDKGARVIRSGGRVMGGNVAYTGTAYP